MNIYPSAGAVFDYRTRVLAALQAATEPITRPELIHALGRALPQAERDRGRTANESAAFRALEELLAEGLVERRAVERPYAQSNIRSQLKRKATGYTLAKAPAPQRSKRK